MNNSNLQDTYLAYLKQEQLAVAVYLINGIKLSGVVSAYDQYVILLKDLKSTVEQLIYKHAVSTIVPGKAWTVNSHD